MFGFTVREKFAKLDPKNDVEVEKLFQNTFSEILNNTQYGSIKRLSKVTPINIKYDILKQYVDNNGGTLRANAEQTMVQYASQEVKNKATQNQFAGGGTAGLAVT